KQKRITEHQRLKIGIHLTNLQPKNQKKHEEQVPGLLKNGIDIKPPDFLLTDEQVDIGRKQSKKYRKHHQIREVIHFMNQCVKQHRHYQTHNCRPQIRIKNNLLITVSGCKIRHAAAHENIAHKPDDGQICNQHGNNAFAFAAPDIGGADDDGKAEDNDHCPRQKGVYKCPAHRLRNCLFYKFHKIFVQDSPVKL